MEPLRQEPEAPFQNATSRDWQKAFNPQRELGAFCSGVNQVGLLRQHCDSQISTTAISYFAIQKYINFQKNSDIEKGLINGTLPSEKNKPIFPAQLTDDLCGILFGVSAKKGQQLLLEPEIEKALNSKDNNEIKKLLEIHKNAFWTVFVDFHLPKIHDFPTMMNYSYKVWNGLWESSSDKCYKFVEYLKSNVSQVILKQFPTNDDLDKYIAVFSLLDICKYDLSKIWENIIKLLNDRMKAVDFDYSSGNKILSDLASCQKQNTPVQYTLEDVPFDNWIKWAAASSSSKISSYLLVKPSDTTINAIASRIKANTPIPDRLYDLISYMVKGGETSWEPMINAIRIHIEWNQGTPSGNIFSIDIFKILSLLSSIGHNTLKSLETIIKNGSFFNLVFHFKQGSEKYAALLLARYSPENLDSIQIPIVANSAQGLTLVIDFWKTNNTENAQFIWNESKPNSDFGFIWQLVGVKSNKLVGDIINIAVKENCQEFFDYKNALKLFKAAINITNNENNFHIELIKCFIKYSQIENEILETNDIDIITFAYELNILLKNTQNKEIINYLIKKINSVTEKQWDKALREDIYLTTLAVTINEKSSELSLANDLYNSLFTYLQAWISNSVTPSESKQKELPDLISMLENDFNQQLKNRLTEHIINIGFKGSYSAIAALLGHINIGNIVTDGRKKIQNVAEDSFRNSDINTLKILDMILSHQDSSKFKPDEHLAKVFMAPMKKLLYSNKEIDKALIKRLALKFKVDVSANSNDIKILSAKYGKGDNMKDVTDIVEALVNDAAGKQVSFPVENEILGGDPLQNALKELKITYSYLGEEQSITVPEHETVTIP